MKVYIQLNYYGRELYTIKVGPDTSSVSSKRYKFLLTISLFLLHFGFPKVYFSIALPDKVFDC